MVVKVEFIATFTRAVCEYWNVSEKYAWDDAGNRQLLSTEETYSNHNRSD